MNVAIIGGGPSGLVTLKELLSVGINAHLFEQHDCVGGLWVFDKKDKNPCSRAYKTLTTNSSIPVTTLGAYDVPIPDSPENPRFATHGELTIYYNKYAEHFNLFRTIHLNSSVKSIKQQQNSQWRVSLASGDVDMLFDDVICATGTFGTPNNDVPWLSTYKGSSIHSAHYRHPGQFEGQHITVLGIGNSALDIALDLALSKRFQSVTICSNGAAIVPVWDDEAGIPGDYVLLSRGFSDMDDKGKAAYMGRASRSAMKMFIKHGMPSEPTRRVSILKRHKDFFEQLESGMIKLKPNVAHADGRQLILKNGETIPSDAILLCTGYRIHYPYLEDPPLSKEKMFPDLKDGYRQDYLELYRGIIDPRRPSLMFVGAFDTLGNTPCVSEMQARWIAAVLIGKIKIPELEERLVWVAKRKAGDIKRGGIAPMYRPYVHFMDSYAIDLGCKPDKLNWPSDRPQISQLYRTEYWDTQRLEELQSKL